MSQPGPLTMKPVFGLAVCAVCLATFVYSALRRNSLFCMPATTSRVDPPASFGQSGSFLSQGICLEAPPCGDQSCAPLTLLVPIDMLGLSLRPCSTLLGSWRYQAIVNLCDTHIPCINRRLSCQAALPVRHFVNLYTHLSRECTSRGAARGLCASAHQEAMVSYEEYLRVALMAAKEAGDALSLIQNGLLQPPFPDHTLQVFFT